MGPFARLHGPWLSLALLVVILMLGAPLGNAAWAGSRDYGVVTIDLRPERGDVPTHLCVVSEVAGPRARQTLDQLMRGAPNSEGEVELNTQMWPEFEAVPSCASPGVCAPRIRVPGTQVQAQDFAVACVKDDLKSNRVERDPRLLVLMLEHLEGSPPALDSLNLAGGVATIGVQLDLRRVVVTARSLGGHYAPHDRSYHAEVSDGSRKMVALPISPRCAWTALLLPGAQISEGQRARLRLVAQGRSMEAERCIGPLDGSSTLRAMLPPGEGTGQIILERRAKDDSPEPDALSFRGQWRGQWPDELLELSPLRIHFRWRGPECIYPRGQCPAASLASGQHCSVNFRDELCHYSCPGEDQPADGERIRLPVQVTFEKKRPVQRWSDTLESPGQILASYVDPSRRFLRADLRDWQSGGPGARVRHIDLMTSDGATQRHAVDGRKVLELRVPHASCELMRYRFSGDREYRELLAPVRDGKVVLAPPYASARLARFGVSLVQGGGPSFMTGKEQTLLLPPTNYLGILQLVMNLRALRPKIPRLSWDFRLGASLGQWGYFEGREGTVPRRIDRRLAWVRFLAGVAAVVDLWPRVRASLGVDFGGSWPLKFQKDFPIETRNFLVIPTLGTEIQIRRNVALDLQLRAIVGESYLRIDTGETKPLETISVAGLYGIRLNF